MTRWENTRNAGKPSEARSEKKHDGVEKSRDRCVCKKIFGIQIGSVKITDLQKVLIYIYIYVCNWI